MKTIRCAICRSATVHGAVKEMLGSERFPSVYLHNGDCRQRVWHVLVMDMGFDPRTPLICELVRDEEIHKLLRTAA